MIRQNACSWVRSLTVLAVLTASAGATPALGASLISVGVLDPANPYSDIRALSSDGSFAVGKSLDPTSATNPHPILWSQSTGLVALPNPSGGGGFAHGVAVGIGSNLGNIIISGNHEGETLLVHRFYKAPISNPAGGSWTDTGSVPDPGWGQPTLLRRGFSNDLRNAFTAPNGWPPAGAWYTGARTSGGREARFRGDPTGGWDGANVAAVNSISGWGILVGTTNDSPSKAFFTNPNVEHTIIPGGTNIQNEGYGISSQFGKNASGDFDVQWIAGYDYDSAFRWKRGDASMTLLGYLADANSSCAYTVADNGVTAGSSYGGSITETATVWDTSGTWDTTGTAQSVQALLDAAGVNTSAWTRLMRVYAVSDDGKVLAGYGVWAADGSTRGFVAKIGPEGPTAPIIHPVTSPDTAVVGFEYTKTLGLDAGYPYPTWSIVTLPEPPTNAPVTVDASGVVSGWTPGWGDIGSGNFQIGVKASNGNLPDSQVQWTLNVVANPPIIAQPSNDTVTCGQSYTKQLTLAAPLGSPPIAWSKISGPASLNVDSNGLVTWTPQYSDAVPPPTGNSFTVSITIQAANAIPASDQKTWTVTVNRPSSVPVVRAVLEGATTATVSSIATFASTATLYKNGGSPASPSSFTPPTATFNVGSAAVGDCYTATQTCGGWESAETAFGVYRACVMPAVLGFPPADKVTPGPDFEGATWSPYWHTANQALSTEQNHTPAGAQSAKEGIEGGHEAITDLTPTSPDVNYPIVLTYWLYFDPSVTNQMHYVRLWDFTGNGFGDGVTKFEFAAGIMGDDGTGTRCSTCDTNLFQYRFGTPTSGSLNMGDPSFGLPPRGTTPAWHKIQIKLGTGLRRFQATPTEGPYMYVYANGLLGNDEYPATLPNIDSVTVGSRFVDASPGYYDDLSIAKVQDVLPTLPANMHIDATEGHAIAPYDVVGTDANDPEWLTLEMVDGGSVTTRLPAGLSASAVIAHGPNTGVKITISGTPAEGTAAGSPYYVSFEVSDERGLSVTSGLLTINVSTCAAPPVVSAISPNTGVEGRTNVRTHPPYDGVTVPSAPVHATITGANFTAGAAVRLAKSGSPDIAATNVAVISDTQITCDIDLGSTTPGALNGAWDVAVTTCAEGKLPGGFAISMCFTPAQDTDGDGDVDLADFSVFQNCFNGPNRPYKLPAGFNKDCYCLDVGDNPVVNDVDLADFNTFQGCFNGPNRAAKASCP